MTFLTVLAALLVYAFIGSVIGGRHHALATRTCRFRDGVTAHSGKPHTCWYPSWCNHIVASIFFFGLLWWLALPVAAGVLIGSTGSRPSRVDRRRAAELDEAKHQAELARLARIADEELELRLNATQRKRR